MRDSSGFTLVELLIVFAIFFVTTTAGTVAFNNYNTAQTLEASSKGAVSFLNSARVNAVTQTMTGTCTQQLQMYSVRFAAPSSYEMLVYCNGQPTGAVLKNQTLPNGVVFDAGTSGEITFVSGSGVSSGGNVVLKGKSASKIIKVDTMGNIAGS